MSTNSNNNDSLRWHQRIILEVLWMTCCAIGYMPRWFRYGIFKPFVYAVIRIVRYRHKIVYQNIRGAFPEKSEKEIKHIVNGSYSTLAEVIVDTICLAGAKRRGDLDHVTWVNRDEHMARTEGRDWIAMASHYGCWEYFPLWSLEDSEGQFLGVYHTLKSDVFEHFYRRVRDYAPNYHQVPMKDTLRKYMQTRGDNHSTVLGLISDQAPILRADTEWFDFLNRKTTFIEGSERIAMRFKIPIYFVHIERVRAGHMAIRFDEIYDGVEEVEPMEITRRYARALESMIREHPELWLWSHNRWKHSPETQVRRFGKMTESGRS
jgi:KDO2-lipid IV(A) lauroyltransferase